MGKRGPRPTPTGVLEARGSWRADARGDEPQPPDGRPKRPAGLSRIAQLVWADLVPVLEDMGVLTSADGHALGRYCEIHAMWLDALKRDDNADALKCNAALLKLEHEFGLTPSSRAGLAVRKKDPNEQRGKGRFFSQAGSA